MVRFFETVFGSCHAPTHEQMMAAHAQADAEAARLRLEAAINERRREIDDLLNRAILPEREAE